MSVDFFEEKEVPAAGVANKDVDGITGFIMKKFSVSQQRALTILSILAVLCFTTAGVLFALSFLESPREASNPGFDEEQLIELHQQGVLKRDNDIN